LCSTLFCKRKQLLWELVVIGFCQNFSKCDVVASLQDDPLWSPLFNVLV
jgi:hypothetical protein